MRAVFLVFIFTSFVFGLDYSSIKSDFTQIITSPEGKELHYSGKFYAKKPYFALWKYEKPIEKMVYFKQNTIQIVEPELEQIIISTLSKTPNISKLLKQAKKIKTNLYQANYENIIYNIHTKNNVPYQITYEDKLDNQTSINFFNTHINIPLNDKIFNFKIPKEYDILRQ